ncbi:DUF998 domain-containing protein [Actinokineospora sp.]|uniref:DUF998 domain-containing protein n=1 Tax=Actinokineospora sp. TaxID=1872133 RepID=UPI0040375F9B
MTLVHSYLFLRRAVGLLGMALPVVLITGTLLAGGGLLNSISGYYYSDLRDVYVGTMCAIGVFLLSYRGYGRVDDVAGNVAAVAAVGAALFPTRPENPTQAEQVIGVLHIVFAAAFFLTLAYFCLVLFRKTDQEHPGPRKIQRNQVYLACGVIMLVCLALIAVLAWFFDAATRDLRPALWLETVAILAFGVAWLIKGETLLRDRSPARP